MEAIACITQGRRTGLLKQVIRHLPLQSQCAACGDMILTHERVMAMHSNQGSTEFVGLGRGFLFRQPSVGPTSVDGSLLCRRRNCDACAAAPEFVFVHYDCYHIFTKSCAQNWDLEEQEVLDQLWTIGAWRSPWPGARAVHLTEAALNRAAVQAVAKISGLSSLTKLSTEILYMIRDFSRHELFWRAISVVASASTDTHNQTTQIPLDQITSWERHGVLVHRTSSASIPPIIRVTVDTFGISKIERLPERPLYRGETMEHLAFIVEDEKDMPQFQAEIKNGLLRLRTPETQTGLQIWNTPSPPQGCEFLPIKDASWQRLRAVDLDNIHGITFFFLHGQLSYIHTHRSESSCAMDTFKDFPNHARRDMVWIYTPIAPNDRVVMLGTRKTAMGFNILIRTRLAGDILVGQFSRRFQPDRYLGFGAPITLVYGEPEEMQPIPVFGGYCEPELMGDAPQPFPLRDLGADKMHNYLSWAPLCGIQTVRVFYDTQNNHCKGILFHYENGGARAVGQCRLHVDQSIEVARPSRLCLRPTSNSATIRGPLRQSVQVEFGADCNHRHGEGNWNCLPLENKMLTFSFTGDSCNISVEEEAPMAA